MRKFTIKVLKTNYQTFLDSFIEAGLPSTSFKFQEENVRQNEDKYIIDLQLQNENDLFKIGHIFGYNCATLNALEIEEMMQSEFPQNADL